jgi:hypothetical protein
VQLEAGATLNVLVVSGPLVRSERVAVNLRRRHATGRENDYQHEDRWFE